METKDCIDLSQTVILAIAGICVTYFYSRHARRLAEDQMMHDLFIRFNERYDRLNQYLEEVATKYNTLDALNSADAKDHRNAVLDFFNLCAEEHYWFQHKKRIDADVWSSWSAGMNYWYQEVKGIRELWKLEVTKPGGRASYYLLDGNSFFKEKEQSGQI